MYTNTMSKRRALLVAIVFIIVSALMVFGFTFMFATKSYAAESEGPTTIYRLYNEWSGEHHYTGNTNEINDLEKAGWDVEGIAWYSPKHSSTPVWRLYNKYTFEHMYTASSSEAEYLVSVGWTREGIAWYSDDGHTRPVYRLFNTNAQACASHHYTVSENEYNTLVAIGWNGEGCAWWGLYKPDADTPETTQPTQPTEEVETPETPEAPDVPDTSENGETPEVDPSVPDGPSIDDSVVPTTPDTPSGDNGQGQTKPKPPIFDNSDSGQTNETIEGSKPDEIGDTDYRGYTYSNFTHKEVKASAWTRKAFDATMDACAGCGQMFSNLYDPNAATHLEQHMANRTKAMKDGTTTERGGTNYQDTTVNIPVATTYTTTEVVDFTCWRTPSGLHDPACTNPNHVVKPDIDESNPVDISGATVTLDAASYNWNNNAAIQPKVSVTYNGQTLVEDTNYQYLKNRSEGDFHVVYYFNRYKPYNQSGETPYLVIVGQNAYKGTKVVPFTINYPAEKPNLLNATVNGNLNNLTIAKWGIRDYDWLFDQNVPTLTLDGKTLTYGKDFEVELTYGGTRPNVGSKGYIRLTFVGCGSYEGRLSVGVYATRTV